MKEMQAAIIPGTVGHTITNRQFKDGTVETRFRYYRSPEWTGKRKPKMRRVR